MSTDATKPTDATDATEATEAKPTPEAEANPKPKSRARTGTASTANTAPVDRNVERTEAATATAQKAAKSAKTSTPKRKGHVLFVSAGPETTPFDMMVAGTRIRPAWDTSHTYLVWSVPKELADRFAAHEFVRRGRIVKSE